MGFELFAALESRLHFQTEAKMWLSFEFAFIGAAVQNDIPVRKWWRSTQATEYVNILHLLLWVILLNLIVVCTLNAKL